MDNLQKIAKVSKSDGTDGAVILSFLSMAPEDLEISEPVFVFFDGLPVPFFVESLSRRGSSRAVVHLTDIRSFEDAEELVGREVYAEGSSADDEDEDLVGWTVKVVRGGETLLPEALGTVTGFLDIPSNPCIEVDTKKGAVVIPLHEDFIVSVDPDGKVLAMSLPDGLI